jgi:putative mRNA 3-end processing factor
MQVRNTDFGLYFPEYQLYFDPQGAVDTAICTHAHADHISPGAKHLYAHKYTIDLIQLRFGENYARNFHSLEYDTWYTVGNLKIMLIPAGHILGSAMVLLDDGKQTLLYSGDFNMKSDLTAPFGNVPKADILITETTFAQHRQQHPNVEKEVRKLANYPFPIFLGVYALGKAQRMNYLINKYLPHKRVCIHHSMNTIHQYYVAQGIPLEYEPYQRKVLKENDVIILYPPMAFNSLGYEPYYLRAFVSGFANRNAGDIPNILISDHADAEDIENLIRASNPSKVYLTHGDGLPDSVKEQFSVEWQSL